MEPTPPALVSKDEDPNEPLLPRTVPNSTATNTTVVVAEAPTQPQTTTMKLIRSARGPAFAAFVMTWFNPNAYVDSILLGSLSVHHPGMELALYAGAMAGTCLWFPGIWLRSAQALRPAIKAPHLGEPERSDRSHHGSHGAAPRLQWLAVTEFRT
ncbi:hypothetical protein [Corynebacterium urogenitale]